MFITYKLVNQHRLPHLFSFFLSLFFFFFFFFLIFTIHKLPCHEPILALIIYRLTVMDDWASRAHYLSIYLSYLSASIRPYLIKNHFCKTCGHGFNSALAVCLRPEPTDRLLRVQNSAAMLVLKKRKWPDLIRLL